MTTKKKRFSIFLIRFYIAAGALVVLLSLLLINSGPRVRMVEFDSSQATTEDSRLVIRFNQPVEGLNKEQIDISPGVDFDVTASGSLAVLQLRQKLHYDTQYKIQISDIQMRDGSKTSDYSYSFKTGHGGFYYLKRNYDDIGLADTNDDQIIKFSIKNQKQEVVYSAPDINEYIYIDGKLIVSTFDGNRNSKLIEFDIAEKESREINLPGLGRVDNLLVSPEGNSFGYSFTSSSEGSGTRTYTSTVFIYNFEDNISLPLKAFSGKDLQSYNWRYTTDGAMILAQTDASALILADVRGTSEPLALGSFDGFYDISADSKRIAVMDRVKGALVVDLVSDERNVVEAMSLSSTGEYVTSLALQKEGYIKLAKSQAYDYASTVSSAILVRGEEEKELYHSNTHKEYVNQLTLSPNEQYVLLSISNASNTQYDSYPNPQPKNISTLILSSADGSKLADIDGSQIIWIQ